MLTDHHTRPPNGDTAECNSPYNVQSPPRKRKSILVSNDDGIKAEGLLALLKELHKQGYDVRVVAPYEEQSAKSHAVTLFGELDVYSHVFPDELADIPAYAVDGTPADCVKLALGIPLFPGWTPDLLISGQYNCSIDTLISLHRYNEGCMLFIYKSLTQF